MGRLIYSVISSLDGYIADRRGNFDWAMPDEEVHRYANAELDGVSTHLYGRRMYELMVPWETDPEVAASSGPAAEFARIWQDADKVVFSTTLEAPLTRRTTLERSFDPARVREIAERSEGDATIDGPTLAAHALRAGIVDEVHQVLFPIVIGDGLAVYPADLRLGLELIDHRRFASGAVALRYRSIAPEEERP
ncbi:dihydrofolate reductase family protein [Rothia sp. AR01]|uniref:Dihydrofolate reductase family protein n=1 Tax=Rothia santali TaxID=2949643 RepID=A0A9X2KHY0_9MICC|nr:dihydrofolate reductase family protein [Rothia santali]MCP3425410.1 dihydrofolate reductase family protein [Rothia santali]